VSFLQLQTLFPVPVKILERALAGCSRVIVVEENMSGLYAGILQPHLGGRALVRVNELGSMIPPSRIEAALVGAGASR
jgi:pyruvate/2-oxoacid:ferredoxin oxidoreductase alpha subunit